VGKYLGNNSLLIDRKDDSYLYKHGFLDENILALKVDSKEEYAFLINENKFGGELNSIESVIDFLQKKYIEPQKRQTIIDVTGLIIEPESKELKNRTCLISRFTNKGKLEIEVKLGVSDLYFIERGQKVLLNGTIAPDGKYKIDFLEFIHVENGYVTKVTNF